MRIEVAAAFVEAVSLGSCGSVVKCMRNRRCPHTAHASNNTDSVLIASPAAEQQLRQ